MLPSSDHSIIFRHANQKLAKASKAASKRLENWDQCCKTVLTSGTVMALALSPLVYVKASGSRKPSEEIQGS